MLGVGQSDTDADADPLTITAVTQGAHGSVVNNGTTVSYTPTAAFSGTDSFTYKASDGVLTSAATTATITISDLAPIANVDHYALLPNSTLTMPAPRWAMKSSPARWSRLS